MPPLTDQQEMVLALLPIFPSVLSFVCSVTIIRIVYRHYKTKGHTTVYHRLLVGMSCCDLFVSFWFPWTAFLMPAETSTRVWAIGTTGTCTFAGFFFNFAFTGLLYNASLSYYFLLTARYGWRDKEISRWVEPVMHFVVIMYPLTWAFALAIMGAYDEQVIGLGCWLEGYPAGCSNDPGPGEEQCISLTLAWLSAGMPLLLSFVSLLVNNSLIYCHVRSTIQKVRQYTSTDSLYNSSDDGLSVRMLSGMLSSGMVSRISQMSLYSGPRRSTMLPQQDSHTRRQQAVAVQAFLYLLAFVLNYIWTMILRNIGTQEIYWTDEYESDLFWLLVMQAIFLPLQGFFNLCVFSRPKYLETRKKFPNHSVYWVFQRAMFGEKEPRHQQPRHQGASPTASNTSNPAARRDNLQWARKDEHDESDAEEQAQGNTTRFAFRGRVEQDQSTSHNNDEEPSNLPIKSPHQPPSHLRKSSDLRKSNASSPRVSSGSLSLSVILRSSVQSMMRSSDTSGPPMDRPVQQPEFDAFLFGFSELSEVEEIHEDEDTGAIPVEASQTAEDRLDDTDAEGQTSTASPKDSNNLKVNGKKGANGPVFPCNQPRGHSHKAGDDDDTKQGAPTQGAKKSNPPTQDGDYDV